MAEMQLHSHTKTYTAVNRKSGANIKASPSVTEPQRNILEQMCDVESDAHRYELTSLAVPSGHSPGPAGFVHLRGSRPFSRLRPHRRGERRRVARRRLLPRPPEQLPAPAESAGTPRPETTRVI